MTWLRAASQPIPPHDAAARGLASRPALTSRECKGGACHAARHTRSGPGYSAFRPAYIARCDARLPPRQLTAVREAASGWPLGRPVSRKSARLCVHVTHAARQARSGLGLASRPARNALRWESRPRCGAQGRVPRDSPSSERLRLDLPASCLYIARCEARLLLVQRAARGDAGIERAVLCRR